MAIQKAGKAKDFVPVNRALISVFDKSGLEGLVKTLIETNPDVQIISSGGTYEKIQNLVYRATEVSEYTGHPEMKSGLVKTLHPKIHAGILSDRFNEDDMAYCRKHNIPLIDMVVVNLYPFEQAAACGGNSEDGRSNIDIGGPTMIRAAAKNWLSVAVVTDPEHYGYVQSVLKNLRGFTTLAVRAALMQEAFKRTAAYDDAVVSHFGRMPYDKMLEPYEIMRQAG